MTEKEIAQIFEQVGLAKIVRELANNELMNAVQSAMIAIAQEQPPLPEGLEEAAENYAHSLGYDKEKDKAEIAGAKEDFVAGAEWMARQGVTIEAKFIRSRLRGHISLPVFFKDGEQFNNGEDVIVQVRKK